MTRTVRGLLLVAVTLLSTGLLILVYSTLAVVHEKSIRREAVDAARTLARVTFSSMFELMRTGWSRAQLEGFAGAVSSAVDGSPSTIQIYRGERVDARFGPIEQPAPDARIRHAMERGTDIEDHSGNAVRFVFPLRAEAACQRCHTNVAVGEVLGAIIVNQSVAETIAENRDRTLLALLPALPIALLATLAVVAFINRRVRNAIDGLSGDIAAVNRVADLGRFASRTGGLGFAEFDVLADGIRQLTGRLRQVAVDRDMLGLELRVLGKLVITTDVVRDWRDYILQLLRDLDTVLPSHALFAVFRVDGEYLIELFWLIEPTEDERQEAEAHLRAALTANYADGADAPQLVRHNIAPMADERPDRAPVVVAGTTRSQFIEEVKIGGIVGIGVTPRPGQDAESAMVMDGVLSTLLNVVGSVRAIHRYTSELEHYATRDPLTNLYNQRVFWELLENERLRASRLGQPFGLLVIDVDHFKTINDGFGHSFGDRYVRSFAATLRGALRAEDAIARYGGDEFVAILPGADVAATVAAAERALEAVRGIRLDAPDGTPVSVSASIGMAVHPDHGSDARDLFLFADNMMYRAKAQGRNRVATPGEHDLSTHFRNAGEHNMMVYNAIAERRVEAFFQPIIDAASGEVVAVEVLARLRALDGRPLPAGEFIEVAERLGIVHSMDREVMRRAFAAASAAGFGGRLLLNASPRALALESFVREARDCAEEFGIAPGRVVFEITERETIGSPAVIERFVHDIRAAGFGLAIDDFGSGFSSFHYLKRFPVDLLKIEGEFISHMLVSEKDRALVRNMVTLSTELGVTCVAECVESAEILAEVVALGIGLAQGYHIGRPTPLLPLAGPAAQGVDTQQRSA